ncbi:hypothetical protein FNF29_04838 [Cafeteria roenbergensis]|uniref:Major facilitator superfamily (MFS) profile domain-containing protein n=1 Tax=Cafeteria roenbergensis TaxID=33653 RepID=A0A5A8CDS3_CAFRO|nr:hypothetical protein FNF29_04838 [Cafeteria roenbergensis]|eukprot:KAA0151146.1 hypothetical protein FNF29_04838 [Cafeteria roenbergensis]
MYDAWDSVSVVGTSLFLPQAITALSSAAGSQAPRALWSFLGSVSTGVSIAAFLAIGPIAEYSDLRVRLMRPCSLAGAAAMLLFLAVQHPSMLWLAALSVVVMRVANRAAGLMYGALLRDTSTPGEPHPGDETTGSAPRRAGGSPARRPDEQVPTWPSLASDAPAEAAGTAPRPQAAQQPAGGGPDSEAAAIAAAHELAARGTAVGYMGMLVYALLAAACFLLPGMLVGSAADAAVVPVNASDPTGPTVGAADTLGASYWLEQMLPIVGIGAFWACGALLVTFPHLTIQRPGPPLPAWVVHGFGCGLADQAEALALTWRLPGQDLLWYLVSWMFLSDAASTATSSAALLVADELGVSSLELAAIAVLGMVTAAGGATGWRLLVRAGILSGTAALHVAILVLSAVLGWVAFMASRWELYALTVIAGVQLGAIASFTRSLLVSMTPRDEQARIGALYELTQKGTSWIGPLAIGAAVQAMGEQHYRAIVVITVAVEVAIGWPMFLLCVNERRGAHAAAEFDRVREAERGGAASPSQGSGRAVAKQAAGAGATGAPAGRNTPPPMPNEVLSPLVLATRAAAKRGPQAPSAPAREACSGGALVGVAGPPAAALQASLLRSKSAALQL